MSKNTTWIKAVTPDNDPGHCVELRRVADTIEVRDSKDGETGPILRFTLGEFDAWLDGVRKGEFDHLRE